MVLHRLVWYLWIIPLAPLWSWQQTASYMMILHEHDHHHMHTHGVVVNLLRICQRSARPIIGGYTVGLVLIA